MRNYSKIGCFLIFCFRFLEVSAQTSSPGGIFNPMLNNAGAVGVNEKIEATVSIFNEDQNYYWVRHDNFFAQIPVNKKHSIGLLYSGRVEYLTLDGYQLFYSYKVPTKNGNLSIGINGGVQSRIANYNLIFIDGRIHPLIDPIFELADRKSVIFGSGVWFQNDSWFAGFSTPNWIDNQIYKRTFYGIAGYKFKVTSFLGIQPTLDWNNSQYGHRLNFSTNLVIKEIWFLGGAINDSGEFSILSQVILWKYGRLGFASRFEKEDYSNNLISTELFLGVQFNRWRDRE